MSTNSRLNEAREEDKQEIARLRAKANRLIKALERTDDRIMQQWLADEINRRDGEDVTEEWYARRVYALKSNHLAVDGLQLGDLEREPEVEA